MCAYCILCCAKVNELSEIDIIIQVSSHSFTHSLYLGFQILSLLEPCIIMKTSTWMPSPGNISMTTCTCTFSTLLLPLFCCPLSLHPFCLSYFTSLTYCVCKYCSVCQLLSLPSISSSFVLLFIPVFGNPFSQLETPKPSTRASVLIKKEKDLSD